MLRDTKCPSRALPCSRALHPRIFPGWTGAMCHCQLSLGRPGKALRQLQKTLYANPHTHKASLCDSEFFWPPTTVGAARLVLERDHAPSSMLPHSRGNQEVEEVFWVQSRLSPHPVLGCLGLLFVLLGRIPKA